MTVCHSVYLILGIECQLYDIANRALDVVLMTCVAVITTKLTLPLGIVNDAVESVVNVEHDVPFVVVYAYSIAGRSDTLD